MFLLSCKGNILLENDGGNKYKGHAYVSNIIIHVDMYVVHMYVYDVAKINELRVMVR